MLIRSHRQEALSRAYIHAIAARCGLGCSFHEFDYGIDLTIHEIERVGTRYRESGFALDVQAKSTTSALATPDRVRYDMEVRAYDDLRQVNAGTPRILVLLVLPEDEGTWTEQQEDYLLESLRNNGMVDVTTVESPASSENAPKSQNGRNSESRPMLQRSSHYYATTLLIRHCAYWMSLRGQPATGNASTIRIDIPRSNLFSIDALNRLIEKVRKGEEL